MSQAADDDRAANTVALGVFALIVTAHALFYIVKAGWKCGDTCGYVPPGQAAWKDNPDAWQWYLLTWPSVLSLVILAGLVIAFSSRASARVVWLLVAATITVGVAPTVVWIAAG